MTVRRSTLGLSGAAVSVSSGTSRGARGLYPPATLPKPGTVNAAALECARAHVSNFAAPDNGRGAMVFGGTLLLWLSTLVVGSWWFRQGQLSTWWGLLLSACWVLVRVGSYIRAFVVMHDAIHNALFTKRWMNTWAGIISGIFVGMDAGDYKRTHTVHHALLGVEEETNRDPDLIILWTTKEWAAWPRGLVKAAARVMTDPLILFTVMAPVWVLAFNVAWPHRVASQSPRARVMYVVRKLLMVACCYGTEFTVAGWYPMYICATLLSTQITVSYAMFLYNVEHTFEGVYRVPKAELNRTAAGLLGSSYLSIPWWWQWATIGVEYHHFHHMNARVPCYRMKDCEATAPPGLWEAAGVRKLSARDGFRSLLLSLWDPEQRCYVPFPEWAWLAKLLEK